MATEVSGKGDPQRSLELLWGIERPLKRGPKPSLTVEGIVAHAIGLADAHGIETVSMRRVAEDHGVTAMSLYSYVPSKAELIDVMLDRVFGEETAEPVEGEGWRAGLERLARSSWRVYERHPWVLQIVISRPPFGPNILAGMEAMLRMVSDIGLTPEEMVSVISTVDNYVQGAAQARLGTSQVEHRTGVSNREWWDRYDPLLERFVNFEQYPTLVALWPSGVLTEQRTDFEFGLSRVLDGIEGYVEDRRNPG